MEKSREEKGREEKRIKVEKGSENIKEREKKFKLMPVWRRTLKPPRTSSITLIV